MSLTTLFIIFIIFVYAKLEVQYQYQYQQIINNVDTAAETFMTCYGRL